MLQHSFVLDALDSTAEDTFRHFEVLIDEHRELEQRGHQGIVISGGSGHQREGSQIKQSRLRQLVPTIGNFHTPLPLCEAFKMYNEKHRLVRSSSTATIHDLSKNHNLTFLSTFFGRRNVNTFRYPSVSVKSPEAHRSNFS
jgi:hypothetical protein